jgi:hypothetical protein
MATSGSTNYTQTRDDIVNDAFALIGYVTDDIQNEDNNFARRMLNDMIKMWQADGLHLWSKTEGFLFLDQYTAKHSITGTSSGAKFANADDVIITQLGAAEAIGQTAITVDSTTGMAASDVVGIVQDDGSTHWSTTASVDDATTITINDATTVAAATDNNVYTFTTYVAVPRRVLDARLVENGLDTNASGDAISEIPMTELAHQSYFELNRKTSDGVPTYWYYDRQRDQGDMYVWPRCSDTKNHLKVTYERFLEDFDSATDNPDLPVEWLSCIKHNLAVMIAPAFGRATKVQEDGTAARAAELKNRLDGWDRETASVRFTIESRV